MAATKHGAACTRAFANLSPLGACPRCDELRAGAPARVGWGGVTQSVRDNERNRSAALRAHSCKASGCAPICTFGDW